MSIHCLLWDQCINFILCHQHETRFGHNQKVRLFCATDMKSDLVTGHKCFFLVHYWDKAHQMNMFR